MDYLHTNVIHSRLVKANSVKVVQFWSIYWPLIGETLGLVSVSRPKTLRFSVLSRSCFILIIDKSPSCTCPFLIIPEVLSMVLSQNIGNLTNLLRSCHVLALVLRLKARESRSSPGLVPLLILKKSQSWTFHSLLFQEVLFSVSSQNIGLADQCWGHL